jgi:metal-responsive CopG/Arc/MetJ family transcriptional regulator
MRTTIEIPDNLRAKLLKAAAERGEKGFSHIMEEALNIYFTETDSLRDKQRRAAALKGQMSKTDGEKLRVSTQAIRESWR